MTLRERIGYYLYLVRFKLVWRSRWDDVNFYVTRALDVLEYDAEEGINVARSYLYDALEELRS